MNVKTKIIALISLLAVAALFFCVKSASAEGYQICRPNADCILGEFLYDDSYDPVTGDVCEVTIHNPDGKEVVENKDTEHGASDGWHAYTFSTSGPEGLYRATMCCDDDGEKICKDKSFMLQAEKAGTSDSGNPDAATSADLAGAKNDIINEVNKLANTAKADASSNGASVSQTQAAPNTPSKSAVQGNGSVGQPEDDDDAQGFWTNKSIAAILFGAFILFGLIGAVYRFFRNKPQGAQIP